MRKVLMLLTMFIYLGCTAQSNKYDEIIKGLSKNYILLKNEIDHKLFYPCALASLHSVIG